MKASKVARKTGTGSEVRAYFADLPADSRRQLKRVRAAIRSAAPSATELISYRIPAFKLNGKRLVYYAAWKDHISLYPLTANLRRSFADELGAYDTRKGTIRFPLDEPVPTALVKRLVKARVSEIRSKAGE